MLMPRLAGAKCTAEYENLSPLAVWRNLRHDGRLQSERWGITSTSLHKMYSQHLKMERRAVAK